MYKRCIKDSFHYDQSLGFYNDTTKYDYKEYKISKKKIEFQAMVSKYGKYENAGRYILPSFRKFRAKIYSRGRLEKVLAKLRLGNFGTV